MPVGTESTGTIEYCGVRFTKEAVQQLRGARAVLTVPRSAIERAVLRRGWQALHPLRQILFGGILLAIGLVPVPAILAWLIHGGAISDVIVMLPSLAVFGAWVVYDGLRRGYHLAIEASMGKGKIRFDRKPDPAKLAGFLHEAERRFGYAIEGIVE